jgi:hypothetical protein
VVDDAAPELLNALGVYLGVVDDFAPGVVEGLYVVGSAALGDWHAGRSDIDIVAVTAEPATDEDASAIRAVHAVLADRLPAVAIDGPYVAWGDLTVEPATGLHRPWVRDGEFHHDGDCFEINPLTWYTLSRYGLTVRGPAADRLEVTVDPQDRVRFVIENLESYWRPIADQVTARLGQRPFTTADLEWCVLGPLRLHYTASTTDVISKRGAGEYGLDITPDRFHEAIATALTVRNEGIDGDAEDRHLATAVELIGWILADTAPRR